MRLNLTPPLDTRDGISAKNARLTNCLKEVKKSGEKAVIRPGLVLDAQASGVGHGLVVFNNELVSVYGATLGFLVGDTSSSEIELMTLPSTANWGPIAYGAGVYCILANQSDAAATSADGITWSPAALPADAFWSAVAWNGSVFCAVADGNGTGDPDAATSADGVTWDYQTMPFLGQFSSIAWNGTVFCAVTSDSNAAATSADDGVTWDIQEISGLTGMQIASDGSRFVVVGDTGASVSTDDGVTWTQYVISASSPSWSAIAWNGAMFLAVRGGFASGNQYATSPDGVSWTIRQFPLEKYWLYCGAAGSTFLVSAYLDSAILVSSDGITWEQFSLPSINGGAVGSDGSSFVVIEGANNGLGAVVNVTLPTPSITALSTITGDYYDFAQSPL